MENEHVGKKVVVKNSIWKVLESFFSKGISMLVSIILARFLVPEDYGIIALTSIFTNLTDILIQGGFSTALIRKKNVKDEDYSSIIGISLLMATIFYLIIYIVAPYVADIYSIPSITQILRVIALSLFCQAFAAVRTAVVARKMKFRELFICTMIANFLSGVIGVVLAYAGFGVWALVFQQLSQQVVLTSVLFICIRIRVSVKLSWLSIRELLPFSLKVLASSLLSFVGDSLYSLTIGKSYSMVELGYYDKGGQFPRQISLYTFSAVSNVFLPIFSSYQDDYEKLSQIFRRILNVSCYIIIAMMAGLCMTAESFISLILTDKWLPCVGVLRWSCLYYIATPILLANVQLHLAIGHAETRVKAEIFRIITMIIALEIMVWKHVSIYGIAAVLAIIQSAVAMYLLILTAKTIGYKIWTFVQDVSQTLVVTFGMCMCIFAASLLNISNVVFLFMLQVCVGIVSFLFFSHLIKSRGYYEMRGIVRVLFEKRNGKI